MFKKSNHCKAKFKGRKRSKIWVDKGSEFYGRSLKLFLQNNKIEMYSPNDDGKSVVAERFIRILKNKINIYMTHKYMTSISENVYIDKIDDIVNKYNKTYHKIVKMKPVDVKLSTYINSSKEISNEDPKLKNWFYC